MWINFKTVFGGILLTACLVFSCARPCMVVNTKAATDGYAPPGTEEIGPNFYVDHRELCNIDWLEYQYWLEQVYGKESATYQASIPDRSQWEACPNTYPEFIEENYFTHPMNSDYPIIGLSYEQVITYTNWRSDRVFEMILIRAGVIQERSSIDESNFFSIDRYFSGTYENISPNLDYLIPRYRLPSIEEWEQFSKGNNPNNDDWGVDIQSKNTKKHLKKNSSLFFTKENTKLALSDSTYYHYTKPSNSSLKSDYSLYELIGNVAEMTSTKGIAKGGSWFHSLEESKITNHQTYDNPTLWLGFRNVCSWEPYSK